MAATMPGLRDNPAGKALTIANARLCQAEADLKTNGHAELAADVSRIRNRILAAMGIEPIKSTPAKPSTAKPRSPKPDPATKPETLVDGSTEQTPPTPKPAPVPTPRRRYAGDQTATAEPSPTE